jgi:hypothetical protein
MALIPCSSATLALFTKDGDTEALRAVPVEAWSEDGTPYIAGATGLVAATVESGLVRLHPAETTLRVPGIVRRPDRAGPQDPDAQDRRDREIAERQRRPR